jgi:mono/diheme cytochrome c family protein
MRKIHFGLLLSALALAAALACASSNEEPGSAGKASASSAASVKPGRGKELYKANCVACHGESGKGDGPGAGVLKPPPRDHTDRAYMSTLSDEQIGDIIRMGGAPKGKPLMPSHPQINGGDLASLVAYVRSLSQPRTAN